MNAATVFNWTEETQIVEDFLASDRGVLHVLGDGAAHASHFGEAIKAAASRSHGERIGIVSIDPLNQATSTPLGILLAICRGLGLERSGSGSAVEPGATYSILNNLRAGGNISVTDVRVSLPSRSEREELDSLVDDIARALANGAEVSGSVVIFRQCHELEPRQRRILWASVWMPALEGMLDHGVKFVFVYSPQDLESIEDAIPPGAHAIIELPTHLAEDDVLKDIVEYVEQAGLAAHGASSMGFARGVLQTSQSVQDLYDRLALARLRNGGLS